MNAISSLEGASKNTSNMTGRSPLNWRLRIGMWLGILGGPIAMLVGAFQLNETSKLKTEGVTVAGKLVDSASLYTGKGRTSHQLTLEYTPTNGEQTRVKQFTVPESVFEQAREAGEAPVTYLPSNPGVSTVGDKPVYEFEPLAMGAGVLVFGLLLLGYSRRKAKEATG